MHEKGNWDSIWRNNEILVEKRELEVVYTLNLKVTFVVFVLSCIRYK